MSNKDKITIFTGQTEKPIDSDIYLEKAMGKVDDVMIIGWDKVTGDIWVSGGTKIPDCLLMLELAKRMLLDMVE